MFVLLDEFANILAKDKSIDSLTNFVCSMESLKVGKTVSIHKVHDLPEKIFKCEFRQVVSFYA